MRLPPLRNALSSRRSIWLRREPRGQLLLDQSLQLGLQCLQGRIWLSLTLQCAIGGILDRQGDIAVLDGLRTWLSGLDRLEQGREEGVLLQDVRIGIHRLKHGRIPSGQGVGLLGVCRRHELQEVRRRTLVLRILGNTEVSPAEAGYTRLSDARQRRHSELAVDLGRAISLSCKGVYVRPVAVEDEFTVLERLAAFLFGPGDSRLRDMTVLEPVGEGLQTLGSLRGCHIRLAVITDDDTTCTMDSFVEVHRQALVLVELAGIACKLRVVFTCADLVAG